jgi:hypothetical protein
MALTMRPAGLSSGIDQDRADYPVFVGEWNIGRIYEVPGARTSTVVLDVALPEQAGEPTH